MLEGLQIYTSSISDNWSAINPLINGEKTISTIVRDRLGYNMELINLSMIINMVDQTVPSPQYRYLLDDGVMAQIFVQQQNIFSPVYGSVKFDGDNFPNPGYNLRLFPNKSFSELYPNMTIKCNRFTFVVNLSIIQICQKLAIPVPDEGSINVSITSIYKIF